MAFGVLFYYQAQESGFIPYQEFVAGTGSMYPTFPKGDGKTDIERMQEIVANASVRRYPGGIVVYGKRYFGYALQRGDIVSFSNKKTAEIISKQSNGSAKNAGFIKRAIALPGDTIELRDGFVKLNGQLLKEPYISSARSSYGGQFLPDCKPLKIPPGHIFVMGDNRKGSNDSRFDVGLVAFDDIESVIPLNLQSSAPNKQDMLKKNWRNTSSDFDNANQPTLDVENFVDLLNNKRVAAGLKPLKYQSKLSQSAAIRASTILKYNDISFEATKSGITMEKAMEQAGYSNIIYGEAPTFGFYTAEELLDNYFQFPTTRGFLLDPKYQETGISAKFGEINGCPTQVVVQHLAGYVAPNYSQEEKLSWEKQISSLDEVITSWEKGKELEGVNQANLNKLLSLLNRKRANAKQILDRINANLWLTPDDKAKIKEDQVLYEQIENLAKELNKG